MENVTATAAVGPLDVDTLARLIMEGNFSLHLDRGVNDPDEFMMEYDYNDYYFSQAKGKVTAEIYMEGFYVLNKGEWIVDDF